MANAVNFNLNQKKLTYGSIVTNLFSGTNQTETETLDEFVTILNHIESAAKRYQNEKIYVKPTLIIDHVTYLADNNPQALSTLQAKAKYWADHNIITVIFVGTDGRAPLLLSQHSDSTRMEYVEVSGMEYPETVQFLKKEFNLEGYNASESQAFKNSKTNILNFYSRHLSPVKKLDLPQVPEEDRIRMVFEYMVFNYIGGNFLDAMKCNEEIREGKKIEYIEEYS